jgi:hypothetical protein
MSILIKTTVKGLAQLRKQMNKASDETRGNIAAAIYQKGFAIMADSTKEVPVDKGFLKGSAYVAPPKSLRDPEVELGYGKKYGPEVHEIRGRNHPTGKDHFLSDPVNRHKSGYTRWIQKKAKENARRNISWRGVPKELPTRPSENRKA